MVEETVSGSRFDSVLTLVSQLRMINWPMVKQDIILTY